MTKTNLRLNWQLETAEERKNFILKNQICPKGTADQEMVANYILWGKEKNGKSAADNSHIEIETRHKTWNRKEAESLDALIEKPTFNESAEFSDVHVKIGKAFFNRQQALEIASPVAKPMLENLFRQIDHLELVLNFWDLENNKRKTEPRAELLSKFNEKEIELAQQEASTLSQYKYLKMRHELVELRKEQYTLRDSFLPQIRRTAPVITDTYDHSVWIDEDIPVYPLGTLGNTNSLVFQDEELLIPKNFTESQLKKISDYLWFKKDNMARNHRFYFDFREPSHIIGLCSVLQDLKDEELEHIARFVWTANYYLDFSDMNEIQREIFNGKINKKTNLEISSLINQKYGRKYAENYISTIFHKQCIPLICKAAAYHLDIIENLFFEEEFKRCTECGRIYRIHEKNFMKMARSKDGFGRRCKSCEAERRAQKKNG